MKLSGDLPLLQITVSDRKIERLIEVLVFEVICEM